MRISKFVLLWIILLFADRIASAKSYQLYGLFIEAQLNGDGSMDVRESRSYRFSDSFRFAFRSFPMDGPVRFDNFTVMEDSKNYRLSSSQEPGTFTVFEEQNSIQVRWFYQARDESRTFVIGYTARDVVSRYRDTAVIYFQFVSDEWTEAHWDVDLLVRPPRPVLRSAINAWLHGPLWGEYEIQNNGVIRAWCEYLPPHRFFEIRALYPVEMFPEVVLQSGAPKQEIMVQEAEWAAEANRQRVEAKRLETVRQNRRAVGKWLLPLLSALAVFIWYRIYLNFGKRHRIPFVTDIAGDIPQQDPPAFVNYLLYGRQISGNALVGTLLDLARRNILRIRQEVETRKSFFGNTANRIETHWELDRLSWNSHRKELHKFENDLMSFFFDELTPGVDSVELKIVQKNKSKFIKFFNSWRKEVIRVADLKKWYDKKSIKATGYSLLLTGILVILCVGSGFLFGIYTVILGAAALFCFIASFFVTRCTEEGERLRHQWKALRKYLLRYHYRTAERTTLIGQLNDYFVYGSVLGLTQKIYQELAAIIPPDSHSQIVPWYVYRDASGVGFSPESFGAAFSSMMATTSSAMSTSTGSGGGASSGGGGGASSGGGGAG